MRKIIIKKELICPFNVCRIHFLVDKEDSTMSINCQDCEYIWNRKSTIVVEEGCLFLDENSKEYKEYEMLHTSICVDNEESHEECIGLPRHSNKFYRELVETIDKPFSQQIEIFNKHMVEELKKKKCCSCGKQIIGKGYVIHDTFGEVDYVLCNKECADKFQEKLR